MKKWLAMRTFLDMLANLFPSLWRKFAHRVARGQRHDPGTGKSREMVIPRPTRGRQEVVVGVWLAYPSRNPQQTK